MGVTMPAKLSSGEKAVIGTVARSDEQADWIAAYRTASCAGHDGDDTAVLARIRTLLRRPDAQMLLDAERAQRETILRQELLAADHALADTVMSAAEMRVLTLNSLMDEMVKERRRLQETNKDGQHFRSMSGFVNACKELLRATTGASPSSTMSEEQALAAVEALMSRSKQVAPPQVTTEDGE